jgi:hypothetical protein
MSGKHRAEDQPDRKSTSERITGKRNDASQGKHKAHDTPTQEGHRMGDPNRRRGGGTDHDRNM